ncbi:MAG: F0F1 ATP synthase subunit C [Bavariicoccus seileri]|uniref:ATP synthase subunit c n=1 Tax=Bavariicoccus seileri TaxID=549685 RepID=A0A3D4S4Q4_9ENTE|nr:F0F1 ATP synthase subunit C [Bavariicoccus seileri]HCS93809.1 F0F1 ATP synthase subunit C [Bavariicoccus seileri]
MIYIAAAIAVGCAALAASFGNQTVIAKTIEAMTRQPEMKGYFRTTMFIGVGLIEAVPIIAVVFGFVLVFLFS